MMNWLAVVVSDNIVSIMVTTFIGMQAWTLREIMLLKVKVSSMAAKCEKLNDYE